MDISDAERMQVAYLRVAGLVDSVYLEYLPIEMRGADSTRTKLTTLTPWLPSPSKTLRANVALSIRKQPAAASRSLSAIADRWELP